MEHKTLEGNDSLLTKRRRKTRRAIILENRKNQELQLARINEEQIRLKEEWREKIQRSLEEAKRELQARKQAGL